MSNSHLVFVYGTLKKGQPNHHFLSQVLSSGGAKFKGYYKTVNKWPLVVAGTWNSPYMLFKQGIGMHISGELYELDDETLKVCDKLEDHPRLYERDTIELQPNESVEPSSHSEDTPTHTSSLCYFLKNFKPELLNLPFYSNYDCYSGVVPEYILLNTRPSDYRDYSKYLNNVLLKFD